jgi:hypothetical protein
MVNYKYLNDALLASEVYLNLSESIDFPADLMAILSFCVTSNSFGLKYLIFFHAEHCLVDLTREENYFLNNPNQNGNDLQCLYS